jgi:hypothetical protein
MSLATWEGLMHPRNRWLCAFPILLLFAALILVGSGCSSASTTTSKEVGLPGDQPSDFAFVASYGPYGKNWLDTFTGTFTKDLISPTKPNPTVDLRLTRD